MPVVVVITLRMGAEVEQRARELLAAFQARHGFAGGGVASAVEEAGGAVVVLLRWADLGSWRRALGAAEVKVIATPLLGATDASVGTYEVVEEVGPGPEPVRIRRG